MSNPNRLKVYYLYRCRYCRREQHRGSSAKWCNLPRLTDGRVCQGPLDRIGGKARTRPPRLAQ